MGTIRSLQINLTKLAMLAAVLALLCTIPSLAQPPQVSAQTGCTYAGQQIYYPGSGYSTCGSGTSSYCPYGGVYPSCSGTSSYCPYGGVYPSCSGTSSYCPYGGVYPSCSGTTSGVNCGTYVSYTGTCTGSCGGLLNGCNSCAYGTSVCGNCGLVGSACNSNCGVYGSTYCNSSCGAYGSTYCNNNCGIGVTYCNSSCGLGVSYCNSNCGIGVTYCNSNCGIGVTYCNQSNICPYPGTLTSYGCSTNGGSCNGTYTVGLNTGCNTSLYNNGVGGSCLGMALQPGQSCVNGQITGATGGVGGCVQYSPTTGQCIQTAAPTTTSGCAQYSTTTGQCIQTAASTTTSGCAQFSTTTGQCVQPTTTGAASCSGGGFATASGCSASTLSTQTNCPGSGLTVTLSGNETAATACPVICYTSSGLPSYESPGQTCPAGTSTTQPAAGTTTTATTPAATTASASPYGAANTYASVPAASTGAVGTGFSISVQAGWNLVGGPVGTTPTQTDGSVYTWKAGDSAYEQAAGSTAFSSGEGAWVHFAAPATISLPTAGSGSASVQLPPGQFVMIGNGGDAPATVTGADHVFTYDPTNGYAQTNTLAPGQGAWAESDNGGTATITWGAATGAAS